VDIQHTVQAELEHIPRGERAGPQNMLRMFYEVRREAGLKKGGSARQALDQALVLARQEHPDHHFEYDEAWFNSAS